jgi:hypothetical protein
MRNPERAAALSIAATQLALIALQLGWIPPLRFFWGFNLWAYLPLAVQGVLLGAALALCARPVRRALGDAVLRASSALPAKPGLAGGLAVAAIAAGCFWLLRERLYYGDSGIIVYYTARHEFYAPEFGASYLFRLSMRLARALGGSVADAVQLAICIAGGAAVVVITRACALLAADRPGRLIATAYVLSAGTLRILAGHVEVYAWVLLCAGAYLWTALSHLRGRCHWALPCLALGIGIWVHLAFLCLAPSLLLLLLHAGRRDGRCDRPLSLRLGGGAVLVSAPTALFLIAMLAAGHGDAVALELRKLAAIAGFDAGVADVPRWTPSQSVAAELGTWRLFSPAQLKYLANAFFLLAPSALPTIAALLIFWRRRLVASVEARLLGAALVPLLVYAFAVYPRWGPYDWDLFALTGLFAACLAAHLLATARLPRLHPLGISVWLVGATHLFVTIPLLWIGIATSHGAGPFAYEAPRHPRRLVQGEYAPWM